MIKRIIFDIDNTLIPWKDEYYDKIGQAIFEKIGIEYTKKDVEDIVYAISLYEQKEQYFNKEKLSKVILEQSKLNLPNNFLELLLTYFGECVPTSMPKEVIDTLEYLSQKYELVTLSNWFEKEQEARLEKVGIRKYFKSCYACENIKMKPNKESYLTAAGEHKVEECIMIGDSIKNDVEGAINCGMQAIYYNPNKNLSKYTNIQSFKELKNI